VVIRAYDGKEVGWQVPRKGGGAEADVTEMRGNNEVLRLKSDRQKKTGGKREESKRKGVPNKHP